MMIGGVICWRRPRVSALVAIPALIPAPEPACLQPQVLLHPVDGAHPAMVILKLTQVASLLASGVRRVAAFSWL